MYINWFHLAFILSFTFNTTLKNMASNDGLNDEEKVYAEEFNTASKHPRVKLFNFTYSLKRNNKSDSIYRYRSTGRN